MATPFTSSGTYTGAALVREVYFPGYTEGVFKNSEVLSHFPSPIGSPGDTAYRWKVHSAPNASAAIFTEGTSFPEADSQEWVSAAVSYVYFAGTAQISGHARDAMRSAWLPGLDLEMTMLRDDMLDLINTTWLGSTYGLEVAVDSTSTYAGITRGSASYFESSETAVSAIVGFADMIDKVEALRDNDIGARPNRILCPWNQVTRIYQFSGQPAVKQIGDADAAPGYSAVSFAGIPVAGVPDMTDTVIAFLDTSRFVHVIHRDFTVKETFSGDSDVYHVTFANALVCLDPKKQGKLTGCTA